MVSCEYIIVMVCAVNKLSLIQEEEEQPSMKLKVILHDSILLERTLNNIMLSVIKKYKKDLLIILQSHPLTDSPSWHRALYLLISKHAGMVVVNKVHKQGLQYYLLSHITMHPGRLQEVKIKHKDQMNNTGHTQN